MTHIRVYALLLAILLLYKDAGTFIGQIRPLQRILPPYFPADPYCRHGEIGYVPHSHMDPEAMNAPTPVSALLHPPVMSKPVYTWLPACIPFHPGSLLGIPSAGCRMCHHDRWSVFALAQTDLKRLLAFPPSANSGTS
jgi:formate hydrogenlyase subunit 3/multisubunit Na+/H+ antiporter MnhD subunit